MALVLKDRVKETSTTTGTGTLTLAGAEAGFQSFAAIGDGNTTYYTITDGSDWEVGVGTYAASGTLLSRDSVLASSNSGSAVSWGAGTRDVFVTYAASAVPALDLYSENAVSATAPSATGDNALALGSGSLADIDGKRAHASGVFAASGDAQSGHLVLRSDTTSATGEALTSDNGTAGATNQVVLPNSSAFAFHGVLVARQKASDGTASASWKIEGLIRREASAAATVLVNSALTVIDNTPGWVLALSADTTNGALAISVTGAASTNIRWVATVQASEVTYA